MGDGVYAGGDEIRRIDIRDAAGKKTFVISPTFVEDAAAARSQSVGMTLQRTGQEHVILLEAADGLAGRDEACLPVKLDSRRGVRS